MGALQAFEVATSVTKTPPARSKLTVADAARVLVNHGWINLRDDDASVLQMFAGAGIRLSQIPANRLDCVKAHAKHIVGCGVRS